MPLSVLQLISWLRLLPSCFLPPCPASTSNHEKKYLSTASKVWSGVMFNESRLKFPLSVTSDNLGPGLFLFEESHQRASCGLQTTSWSSWQENSTTFPGLSKKTRKRWNSCERKLPICCVAVNFRTLETCIRRAIKWWLLLMLLRLLYWHDQPGNCFAVPRFEWTSLNEHGFRLLLWCLPYGYLVWKMYNFADATLGDDADIRLFLGSTQPLLLDGYKMLGPC